MAFSKLIWYLLYEGQLGILVANCYLSLSRSVFKPEYLFFVLIETLPSIGTIAMEIFGMH